MNRPEHRALVEAGYAPLPEYVRKYSMTQTVSERLRGDMDACPFCGRDPYHYVDIGVGMQKVAVECCDLGIALIQYGDEQLQAEVALRTEAADLIDELVEALQFLADVARATKGFPSPLALQQADRTLARAKGGAA